MSNLDEKIKRLTGIGPKETDKLLYEWVKTGVVSLKEFRTLNSGIQQSVATSELKAHIAYERKKKSGISVKKRKRFVLQYKEKHHKVWQCTAWSTDSEVEAQEMFSRHDLMRANERVWDRKKRKAIS